jgi:hypothetical protein
MPIDSKIVYVSTQREVLPLMFTVQQAKEKTSNCKWLQGEISYYFVNYKLINYKKKQLKRTPTSNKKELYITNSRRK